MAKQTVNVGASPNDNSGDSIRVAFQKINANFTELYTALGLDEAPLNLGAFEFTGSTITTTDSSSVIIDQATTVTSDLTVGGDILPSTALGGDLGSSTKPWKSLYVSNNTIFIGGTPIAIDGSGNLTVDGSTVSGFDVNPSNTLTATVAGFSSNFGEGDNISISNDLTTEIVTISNSLGEQARVTLPTSGPIGKQVIITSAQVAPNGILIDYINIRGAGGSIGTDTALFFIRIASGWLLVNP